MNSEPSATGYRVTLPGFEGPLDLLLHLVRANEVEITDIPIVEITAQYNAYLELMREFNLEIAGEYLVMAATLMHIKSQMLLPIEAEDEDEAADPRAELAQQLLEYQRIKQVAENLQAMEGQRSLVWTRSQIPAEFADEELLTVDMFDLLKAFKKLVGRLDAEARIQVRRDTVSVADKAAWLRETLAVRGSVELQRLFEELETRLECVATFLAMLELMRMGRVVAFQRKLFGEIRLAWVPETSEEDRGERHDEPAQPAE